MKNRIADSSSSATQFRRLKKAEAARRSWEHMRQSPVVYNDCVLVPEIDGGQIVGEDLLRLHVIRTPPRVIAADLGIVEHIEDERRRRDAYL